MDIKEWKKEIPFVLNFHITKACNMKCVFCFGGFSQTEQSLTKDEWISLIKKIGKEISFLKDKRINFAGGEPLLIPYLAELIKVAKEEGFKTSIITNGSLLTESFIKDIKDYIDMIGISIDNISEEVNEMSGRKTNKGVLTNKEYIQICNWISNHGIKLKINTVIHQYNTKQDMSFLLDNIKIDRWKVLRMLKIQNENSLYSSWHPNVEEFQDFVNRHKKYNPIIEDNEDMISTYLFVSPNGYLMDNSNGTIVNNTSLMNNSLSTALNSLDFNFELFSKRYK